MKKLIAVAVLSALAAPAFADSGNVTISGYVRGGYQHVNKELGANDTAQSKIDGRAELTFAGTEDLGNGLTTVWAMTTRTAPDGSGVDEGGTSRDGTLGNQEAFLGLKSASWGQIRLGANMDNFNDGKHNPFIVYGGENFGRITSTKNTVRYDLPSFGALTSSVQYSLGEDKNGSFTGASANSSYSIRVDYDADNWDVGGAYEGGKTESTSLIAGFDNGASANQNKVKNYSFTAGWKPVAGLGLGFEYQNAKLTDVQDSTNWIKGRQYGFYANYTTGKLTLKGEYLKGKGSDSAGSLKRTTYALGADYALSKRTVSFVEYAHAKTQDANAENKFFVGLKHSF